MDLTTALDGQLLRKPEDAACETKPDLKQKDASASKKRIVQTVVYHLPLAHFPPTFLTHLPPVDEPFTPYV